MMLLLAFRHLLVRPVRALVLLFGFAAGSATMIVLLSVGEAMLVQSRDVSLTGGGEVTVLPEGLDLEALRTGALTGMHFGVDRARFVHRVMLAGPRQRDFVADVSPSLDGKLVYLHANGTTRAVRAGGEIPSLARALGAGLEVRSGAWEDSPADSAWARPTGQQLYDELDRFHLPAGNDSTWAEWHYFNLVTGPEEWWYITYYVTGDVRAGRHTGRLLITHRLPDGRYERFEARARAAAVRLQTSRADLRIGASEVTQRSGLYFLDGVAEGERGVLWFQLTVRPDRARWFPPVELRDGPFVSGYVIPAPRASASGRFCVNADCETIQDAPAYHDHNWGVWRDVVWEWGQGRGRDLDVLYGGVTHPAQASGTASPYFLAVVDSLGVRQVLRFAQVEFTGRREVHGDPGIVAPGRLRLTATRDRDQVTLEVDVLSVLATRRDEAAGLLFLQMRGAWRLEGAIGGEAIEDQGFGFFETYCDGLPAALGDTRPSTSASCAR